MLASVFFSVAKVSLTVSAVIVVILLLYPLLRKRYAAKWRYWAWLVLAVRLLIPYSPAFPQAPVRIPQPVPMETGVPASEDAAEASEVSQPTASSSSAAVPAVRTVSLPEIASIVWAAGAVLSLLCSVAGYFLFRKTVSRLSTPVRDPQVAALWKETRKNRKIKHRIPVLRCRAIDSPMMTGFFKPVLLLPCVEFDAGELKLILQHESVHYRRKDVWYKLLIVCARAVHWFNPLVYGMAVLADNELEMVCDSEMVKNTDLQGRKRYGQTILSAIHKGNLRRQTFSTSFYGGKRVMKERFFNILDTRKKHHGMVAFCLLLIAVCAAGGLVACGNVRPVMQTGADASVLPDESSFTPASVASSMAESTATAVAAGNSTTKAGKSAPTAKASATAAQSVVTEAAGKESIGAVVYQNSQYGFNFLLPASWKGYAILQDTWTGTKEDNQTVSGPKIVLRHPLWTENKKWQDIPLLIFTLDEWSTVVKGPSQEEGETLFIGAGPNGPSELGRNSSYVFALPARFDFTADVGIEEVHGILNQNPLQPLSAAR